MQRIYLCRGSVQFPLDIDCGKVHSILDSLWWAWQPRFPNPSDPLRTSVSQDSCRSVVAKLSQQLLGPNSFSGQRRPGHACTKELREEHWHQREYPRNLPEMGLARPPQPSQMPPEITDIRWWPFSPPIGSLWKRFRNFINCLLIYIKCVCIHYPGEGCHSESAGS